MEWFKSYVTFILYIFLNIYAVVCTPKFELPLFNIKLLYFKSITISSLQPTTREYNTNKFFIFMSILLYFTYIVQMLKLIPIWIIYIAPSYIYNTYNIGNNFGIYVSLTIGWPPFHFLIYFTFMWQNHPT